MQALNQKFLVYATPLEYEFNAGMTEDDYVQNFVSVNLDYSMTYEILNIVDDRT